MPQGADSPEAMQLADISITLDMSATCIAGTDTLPRRMRRRAGGFIVGPAAAIHAMSASPSAGPRPGLVRRSTATCGSAAYLTRSRSQVRSNAQYRVPAARAGGAGFVSKRDGLDELVAAIRRVAGGEVTWSQADIRAARNAPKPPSAREREVLAGVAAGRSNKEIAADLGVAERTIESHLGNMYVRYDVSNRIELLRLSRRWGWIS